MLALCVESSHARGMGHFYRALNLALEFEKLKIPFVVYINSHPSSLKILDAMRVPHRVVDFKAHTYELESHLISLDNISLWINDRLNTEFVHARSVKTAGIPLVTFDDRGTGAELADLHIAALSFDQADRLKGRLILQGLDYIILNPKIKKYARQRTSISSILVTLGGSDTYGVTIKVVRMLRELDVHATIIVGPAFQHMKELKKILTSKFTLKQNVDSLIHEFSYHDVAITGGGITPIEANASGLPCVIIANELFEIPVGKELERIGSSLFSGFHENLQQPLLPPNLAIASMSSTGLKSINLEGMQRVLKHILQLHSS